MRCTHRLPALRGPGKAPATETTTTTRAIPGHLQQTGDRSSVPRDWRVMEEIHDKVKRLIKEALATAKELGRSREASIVVTKLEEAQHRVRELPEFD